MLKLRAYCVRYNAEIDIVEAGLQAPASFSLQSLRLDLACPPRETRCVTAGDLIARRSRAVKFDMHESAAATWM